MSGNIPPEHANKAKYFPEPPPKGTICRGADGTLVLSCGEGFAPISLENYLKGCMAGYGDAPKLFGEALKAAAQEIENGKKQLSDFPFISRYAANQAVKSRIITDDAEPVEQLSGTNVEKRSNDLGSEPRMPESSGEGRQAPTALATSLGIYHCTFKLVFLPPPWAKTRTLEDLPAGEQDKIPIILHNLIADTEWARDPETFPPIDFAKNPHDRYLYPDPVHLQHDAKLGHYSWPIYGAQIVFEIDSFDRRLLESLEESFQVGTRDSTLSDIELTLFHRGTAGPKDSPTDLGYTLKGIIDLNFGDLKPKSPKERYPDRTYWSGDNGRHETPFFDFGDIRKALIGCISDFTAYFESVTGRRVVGGAVISDEVPRDLVEGLWDTFNMLPGFMRIPTILPKFKEEWDNSGNRDLVFEEWLSSVGSDRFYAALKRINNNVFSDPNAISINQGAIYLKPEALKGEGGEPPFSRIMKFIQAVKQQYGEERFHNPLGGKPGTPATRKEGENRAPTRLPNAVERACGFGGFNGPAI